MATVPELLLAAAAGELAWAVGDSCYLRNGRPLAGLDAEFVSVLVRARRLRVACVRGDTVCPVVPAGVL